MGTSLVWGVSCALSRGSRPSNHVSSCSVLTARANAALARRWRRCRPARAERHGACARCREPARVRPSFAEPCRPLSPLCLGLSPSHPEFRIIFFLYFFVSFLRFFFFKLCFFVLFFFFLSIVYSRLGKYTIIVFSHKDRVFSLTADFMKKWAFFFKT